MKKRRESEILMSKLSEGLQKRLQQRPGGRLLMCRILMIWNLFLIFSNNCTRIASITFYSSLDSMKNSSHIIFNRHDSPELGF